MGRTLASEGTGLCCLLVRSTGLRGGYTLAFSLTDCILAGSAQDVVNLPVSLSIQWGRECLPPSGCGQEWEFVRVRWADEGAHAFQTGMCCFALCFGGVLLILGVLCRYVSCINIRLWEFLLFGLCLKAKSMIQGHENDCLQYYF